MVRTAPSRELRTSSAIGQLLARAVEEGADCVLRLVAEHGHREPVAGVPDGLVPGEGAPHGQLLLRVPGRLREACSELLGPLVDSIIQLSLGDSTVDETPLRRLA